MTVRLTLGTTQRHTNAVNSSSSSNNNSNNNNNNNNNNDNNNNNNNNNLYFKTISNIEIVSENFDLIHYDRNQARRRWTWIGYVVRMPSDVIPKITLRWTPNAGRRRRGRPKETWRRSFEREMKKNGLSWAQVEHLARNRGRLAISCVGLLCHRARRGLSK